MTIMYCVSERFLDYHNISCVCYVVLSVISGYLLSGGGFISLLLHLATG